MGRGGIMNHIIDTPDGIAHFQMARCLAALKIEVETGMKMSRGSILKAVQQQFGIKAKTKVKALAEMRELYATTFGREYGSPVD